ncbi:hypothetical protein [Gynuella sunshinyii]|uniref:Uncharacterized protein n=1 Tax=Gynuella sunshinyii YC6258 TaxID=1445510 RepID=A0A0C5V6C3_9GAMM|nr:hypothetical protein [Gynuella sunshinyii]AJQ95010.1 hypothetical Protein YC6258_02972 [Gynuella sunshinyii YC6258]
MSDRANSTRLIIQSWLLTHRDEWMHRDEPQIINLVSFANSAKLKDREIFTQKNH